MTDKAATFVKHTAEQAAKDTAQDASSKDDHISLKKHRWVPVKLVHREEISHDTRRYTFSLPKGQPLLGLGTCQHVQIGFHLEDKMLIRSYTPTKPLLPYTSDNGGSDSGQASLSDGQGAFDLTVKTYFPDETQPGGALSNILDCLALGSEVELKGPTGEIEYRGNGNFFIEGHERHFKRVSLVLGGSGITPGYALIARILLDRSRSGKDKDQTELRVVDANKTESDILLRKDLADFEKNSGGQLKITHVLSHPADQEMWNGETGHVDAEIIKRALFEPAKDSVVFLCGPPAMIQKAAMPALRGKPSLGESRGATPAVIFCCRGI